MIQLLTMFIMVMTPAAQVQSDGVEIAVFVDAQIYSWEVTNISSKPINQFEVRAHRCYNHRVPDGWHFTVEGSRFLAEADDFSFAIYGGQTRTFSARVASTGGVLGWVPASVGFTTSDETVTLEQVWGPVGKPRGMVALVVLVILGIVLVHVVFIGMRTRRQYG